MQLGSVPLGSAPLGSGPLGSAPLRSVPLGSVQLGSVQLGSVFWSQKPLCCESVCFCKAGSCDLALRKMALRSLTLCKLVCASCSAQVLCAIRRAQVALCCRSCGNVLCVLFLYLKVAIFQPELREHAPHTTSVLKSCDFPTEAAGARSAYYVCTQKLRFSSRSCRSTLRVLRLYLKAAIFKPELPRTRGESNPRPRDCESRRASHETSSKGHFEQQIRTSTTRISAEGRARTAEIVKVLSF